MADKQVYALDDGGNRVETLSAEKILEAIQTAIATGEIPAELQTIIDTIKEQNKGAGLKFWLGTQAEFLALESTSEDVIYFINDSANLRDVAEALAELKKALEDGSLVVKKATEAKDYDKINGKIKDKFDDIEKRLTDMGFNTGSVTGISGATLTRYGKYARLVINAGTGTSNLIGTMSFTAKKTTKYPFDYQYNGYKLAGSITIEGNQIGILFAGSEEVSFTEQEFYFEIE